ncbi:MAG TPA: rod shape-determining protein [Vicinamibacterales bacterium]|nr:rod shape-determining protein [Vicinamibacterales bacterium]
MGRLGTDLAIDLGTANTCVFAPGHGVVLNEPSLIAFNTASGHVEAVGNDARGMLGRSPGNLRPVRPIRDGVIADFDATEKMLTHFIKKTYRQLHAWTRPRVVIGVPTEITPVERRAVKDSAYRAKASEVYLVEEPMAAALGAGLPIGDAAGNMIIDIGGGTTDIAVISLFGVVIGRSVRVAGDAMDEAIAQFLKKRHDLLVGERTAEAVKIEIGSAAELDAPVTMEVKGRHMSKGVPRRITITDAEIREALAEPLKIILRAVRETLDQIPPEISADIYDRGIALCGGGSLLRHLDRRLREETRLPVQLVEDPLSSVVLGAGKMLSDERLLKTLSVH